MVVMALAAGSDAVDRLVYGPHPERLRQQFEGVI